MLWTKAGDDNSIGSNSYPFEPPAGSLVLERPAPVAAVIDEVWKKSRATPSALGLCY